MGNEDLNAWINSAYQDFNRQLGPRISTRKAQDLLGSFLKQQEGSREALETLFQKFPTSAKEKAVNLLNQYSTGFPASNNTPVSTIVSDFQPILNPNASQNVWFETPYTERYTNNPEVQKFLTDKQDLLQKRGAYIQAEAAKGNIDPYVKHVNWIKKQNLFPTDAESTYDIGNTFLKTYGLSGLNTSEVKETDVGGLFAHDVFSHGYPEKYMGIVDKTLPNALTAADESRATLIDESLGIGFGGKPLLTGKEKVITPKSKLIPELQKQLTSEIDVNQEADYFVEKYLDQAKKENYVNLYGTELDPTIDPLVKQIPGSPSINESFRNAARARYPSVNPKDVSSLMNKAILPYARDLKTAQQLQLFNEAEAGLSEFTGSKVSPAFNTLFKNTYFAADPATSALAGGANLFGKNLAGTAIGASTSLLNPDVAKAIENNRYGEATSTVAKDVATGALAEAGIKTAIPIAGKFAPGLVRAAAPVARLAGPVATGAALFAQGQPGSLTDVITRKAAANPVSWLPSVKPNPQTDIGARAGRAIGNEARYMWQQLLRGRIPYTR